MLEQEVWSGGTGILTKLDLVKTLSAALYGTENELGDVKCGVDEEGNYKSGLYVYSYVPGLAYDIGITNSVDGLGTPIFQEVEVRELISFSLENKKSTKYPIHSVISAEWGADTWDSSGAVTSSPAISVDGNEVKLSKKVYGTVILTYRTARDAYRLRVPPRINPIPVDYDSDKLLDLLKSDAAEHIYDSYAWARWNGGVKLLKLEPPPGAGEAFLLNSPCLNTGIGRVNPDDRPEHPPIARAEYETVLIDYCTQLRYEYYV